MAKQTLVLKTKPDKPVEDQEVTGMELESEEDLDFEDQIKQITEAEGMDEGRVQIRRRAPNRPDWVFCGDMSINDFSVDQVKRIWGGGDYRIRFKNAMGQYKGHKTFTIDYNCKPDAESIINAQNTHRERNDDSLATAVVGKVMDKLSPEKDGQQNVMLEMLKMQREQSNQFLALMMKSQSDMVTAMSNIFAAQKPSVAPQQQGMDLLAAIQVFDKLKGPGQNFDVIELFRLVKEMAEESGGKPESWLDKLAPFIPMLLGGGQPPQPGQPGMAPMGPQPQQMRTALPAPPGSSPIMPMPAHPVSLPGRPMTSNGGATVSTAATVENPALPANPPSTPEEMKALIVFVVRQKLPQLREFALQGADPYDVATLVSNPIAVPRAQFFQLCDMLEKETWIADIFGSEEAISPFKVWFEGLRKEILDEREALLHPEKTDEN